MKHFDFKAFLVLLLGLSSLGVFGQNYSIEKWYNGKASATVLTYDDWSPGHGPIAIPNLQERGLVGSFYVTTANAWSQAHWDQMNAGVTAGMEMGNHTINHNNLSGLSAAQLEAEVNDAKDIIDGNVTGQKAETFVYPRGDYNAAVIAKVKERHFAARKFDYTYNKTFSYEFATTEDDYYTIPQIQLNDSITVQDFAYWMDHGVANNALMVFTFHSISNASVADSWYDEITEAQHEAYLDELLTYNNTWVATFRDAVKYHKEAHAATLTTVSENTQEIVLSLTDTLSDNGLYNHPLTVKLEIPAGATYGEVEQNGVGITSWVDGGYIYFNAIPDGGNISINKSGVTLAIVSPVDGAEFEGLNAITLSANADAQGSSISNVTFTVDGQNLVATTGSPYSVSWTPSTFGNYTINVVANAANGNSYSKAINVSVVEEPICTSPEWEYGVVRTANEVVSYNGNEYRAKWYTQYDNPEGGDPWELLGPCGGGTSNQAPTVSITAPSNGASFVGLGAITFSANAADADGTVAKVTYTVGGSSYDVTSGNPFSYAWTPATAGSYTLTAVATDNDGATSTVASVSFTVTEEQSNAAPTVAITSPANGTTYNDLSAVTVSVNAADADGTVSKVTYTVNGANATDVTVSPFNFSFTPSAYGSYTIAAVATDNEGAVSSSASVTLNFEDTTSTGGGCTADAWVSANHYTQGSVVSHNGHEWNAKWYANPGEEPGANQWNAWEDLGACGSSARVAFEEMVVNAYPVPASDMINVEVSEYSTVEIYNLNGQQMRSQTGEGVVSFQVADLTSGVYFIKVTSEAGAKTIKFAKQ